MLVMFILLKQQSGYHGNNYIWLLITLPFCIWERMLTIEQEEQVWAFWFFHSIHST